MVDKVPQRVERADVPQPGPAVHHRYRMQLAVKLDELHECGLPQRGGEVGHRDRRGRVCAPAVRLPAVMVADLAFERGLAAGQVGAVAARMPQFLQLRDGDPEAAQGRREFRVFRRAGRR